MCKIITFYSFKGGVGRSFLLANVAAYRQSLQRLDWDALYNERDFAGTLNHWKIEWKKEYDFVLVDSRTGLADTVGICTIHLPDELVMVFSANEQSINGGCRVLQKAVAARADLRYSPGLPNIIPVLSRLDQQAEDELSKHWLAKVRNLTAELFHSWLPHTVSLEEYYGTFKVPHFARWSFGEELPVLLPEETGADSQTISYYLHRIGDLLDGNATDLDYVRPGIHPPRVHQLCLGIARAQGAGTRLRGPVAGGWRGSLD